MKVVIAGGVAGGASAATRFRILIKTNHEVTNINVIKKTVTVKNLFTGEAWRENYDKLLLSPGAKPVKPNLSGSDSEKIFVLRTVEDTFIIRDYVESTKAQSAVIVSGGYIGIEVVENLKKKGLNVTMVQRPNQLMNTLDYDMATFVHSKLRANGISLKLNSKVIGFRENRDSIVTLLEDGQELSADMLKDLELAYAPPFSSAKDPVNMAGFMIENISNGIVKQYHWDEVEDLPRDGSVTLLDARTAYEFKNEHIDGYINIPVDDLRDRLSELNNSKPVYVICQSGLRSYIVCSILSQNVFDCYNFSDGYRFYTSVIQEKQMSECTYPCGMDAQRGY